MKKSISFPLLICLAACIPVILSYLHNGYFPTHDGEWAVVRLADMFRELHDLQIPPRFSGNLNYGYGYPLFNFAYPLPYYIAMLFHFLKFGFVNSIKLTFALSVFISAIGMYLFAKDIWKSKLAGIISSILYIYFPYRIVDLYVRGSIGESVAFAIVPFIFLGLYNIYATNKKFWISLTAVSFGTLILAHNIMAVEFSIIIVGFIVILIIKNPKKIFSLIISIILGGLLSAFFSIPALFEKQYILLSKIPIADRSLYFVKLPQLFISPWGYGTPTDPLHPFTYQIGIPQIISLIVGIFILWQMRAVIHHSLKFINHIVVLFVIISCIFIFLLFAPSALIWKLPLLKEINYPWTLLGPLGFTFSLVGGYLARGTKSYQYIAIALAVLSVVLLIPVSHPEYYTNKGDNFYVTNDATTTSSQELMPLWVKNFPSSRPLKKVEIQSGKGSISNINFNSKKIQFWAYLEESGKIRINTIYYPGWHAIIDGSEVPITYSNPNGLMEINAAAGNHNAILQFRETPLRLYSDMISVAALIGMLCFGIIDIIRINR